MFWIPPAEEYQQRKVALILQLVQVPSTDLKTTLPAQALFPGITEQDGSYLRAPPTVACSFIKHTLIVHYQGSAMGVLMSIALCTSPITRMVYPSPRFVALQERSGCASSIGTILLQVGSTWVEHQESQPPSF